MALDQTIREVETAINDLRKAASSTDAWSDKLRSKFDSERMEPLVKTGKDLMQAMERAQEQVRQAEKLLADNG